MAKRAVQVNVIKLGRIEGTVDIIKFFAARAGNPNVLGDPHFFHEFHTAPPVIAGQLVKRNQGT
jgi:hypothetical protein